MKVVVPATNVAELLRRRAARDADKPLADRVVTAFRERAGLILEQGYGLTEAAPVVTSTIGTPTFKSWSTGRALPGVEVRVVDDAGHIGFLDSDGDLFLVDRLKNLVTVSGFNVYPAEIEDVVCEVSGVRECAVIGVPAEATGEAVVAYVVSQQPNSGTHEALVQSIEEHCAQRLARFKVPARISVVTDLPHSATGKVAKGRLRAADARRTLEPA